MRRNFVDKRKGHGLLAWCACCFREGVAPDDLLGEEFSICEDCAYNAQGEALEGILYWAARDAGTSRCFERCMHCGRYGRSVDLPGGHDSPRECAACCRPYEVMRLEDGVPRYTTVNN